MEALSYVLSQIKPVDEVLKGIIKARIDENIEEEQGLTHQLSYSEGYLKKPTVILNDSVKSKMLRAISSVEGGQEL